MLFVERSRQTEKGVLRSYAQYLKGKQDIPARLLLALFGEILDLSDIAVYFRT